MSTSPVRILIVDDFEPFRRFISQKLQSWSDLQVICEASDGLEAVRKVEELHPDLILLDIGLPKLAGIEVARRLSLKPTNTRVLFVSENCESSIVDAALNTGAKGYLAKTDAGSDLLPAIRAVLRNEVFLSTKIRKTRESP